MAELKFSLNLDKSFLDCILAGVSKSGSPAANTTSPNDDLKSNRDDYVVMSKRLNKCIGSISIVFHKDPEEEFCVEKLPQLIHHPAHAQSHTQMEPSPEKQPLCLVNNVKNLSEKSQSQFQGQSKPKPSFFSQSNNQLKRKEVDQSNGQVWNGSRSFSSHSHPQEQEREETLKDDQMDSKPSLSSLMKRCVNETDVNAMAGLLNHNESNLPMILSQINGNSSGNNNSLLNNASPKKRPRVNVRPLSIAPNPKPRKSAAASATSLNKCYLCDYSTIFTSSMQIHITSVHSAERPYSCALCPYTCKLKGNLKKHYLGTHKLTNDEGEALLQTSYKPENLSLADSTQVQQLYYQVPLCDENSKDQDQSGMMSLEDDHLPYLASNSSVDVDEEEDEDSMSIEQVFRNASTLSGCHNQQNSDDTSHFNGSVYDLIDPLFPTDPAD